MANNELVDVLCALGLMKRFSGGFLISVSLSTTDFICLIKHLIFNSLRFKSEEADRSKQGNLSFSHIVACLPTNSVMAFL